jgi:hypothetical protein
VFRILSAVKVGLLYKTRSTSCNFFHLAHVFTRSKRTVPVHRQRATQAALPAVLVRASTDTCATSRHTCSRHAHLVSGRRGLIQETYLYHTVIKHIMLTRAGNDVSNLTMLILTLNAVLYETNKIERKYIYWTALTSKTDTGSYKNRNKYITDFTLDTKIQGKCSLNGPCLSLCFCGTRRMSHER